MIVMERAQWMSSPGFEIATSANEFLNCCNRYRNEPLGADKNSLDLWKAKKEDYLTLATYLIFVTGTTGGACAKKSALCKFLQI